MCSYCLLYLSLYCRSASTTPSGSPCSSQQSVYHPGDGDASSALTVPHTQPAWNPFGDDNFSKLTAEELLNKDFAKLAESKFSLFTHSISESFHDLKPVCFFSSFGLCTAAAAGEKAAGSNENLIPSLNAFPGKSLFSFSQYASDSFVKDASEPAGFVSVIEYMRIMLIYRKDLSVGLCTSIKRKQFITIRNHSAAIILILFAW